MYLMLDNVGWIADMLRPLMAGLDSLVYTLLGWIIEGIFNLSQITTSASFLETIYRRIYLVLSIFMVFKLTFSFIQYLVNPDAMADKERGVGKLIARTITMLCILIILPILFFSNDFLGTMTITEDGVTKEVPRGTILNVLQRGGLETIPKLILGISDSGTISSNSKEYGEQMALMMLRSFYYPIDCKNADTTVQNNECDIISSSTNIASLDKFESSVTMVNPNNSNQYHFYYQWPLTTIAGILLIVIMLGISIDVAIRTFKLMILQMIAPVPVMTYIDPKSSKDGAFNSWLKTFISTYIDIFVKLALVYLVLLLVSKLFSGDLFDNMPGGFMSKNYVMVFLIIGLFKFAKDAPKFVKDALGIKDSGGGGGFMGKALSGMAGAAAGFAGGLATGGLAGGLSGLATGYSSGLAGKAGQAFSQVRDEQAKLLGKTPGGMRGKLQNKAMQRSVMKHTGLDENVLKNMKNEKIAADNALAQAEADYANGIITANDLFAARERSGKANSAYESANSLAKQIGLKPGFMQENKRHGAAYVAAARVGKNINAGVSSVKGKVDSLPSTQWIKDKANDISDIPGNIRHSIDSTLFGGDANADQLQMDREIIKEDKTRYKNSLRGGIGNTEDPDQARKKLKNDRKAYRDDQKNFR